MPNIANKNGIDMGNIASMNGQDIASGGAYNPVTGSGTYTETVPSGVGLYKRGGYNTDSNPAARNLLGSNPCVMNFSSDVDGILLVNKETLTGVGLPLIQGSFQSFTNWAIDSAGKLWRVSKSSSYGGSAATEGTNPSATEWRQVTGVTGASDTGWTCVSCQYITSYFINGGKLFVIGNNGNGQFGNGGTTASYGAIIQVGSDTDWVWVSSGGTNAAFAIKGSSRVMYSCGTNSQGFSGQGTTSGNTTTWTAIDDTNLIGGTNENWVTMAYTCHNTVCAIQAANSSDAFGKAFFWGYGNGSYKQFGMGSGMASTNYDTPILGGNVSGTPAADWTGGCNLVGSHMLVNSSGELWYCGYNGYGQNFSGNTTNASSGDFIRCGSDSDWVIEPYEWGSSGQYYGGYIGGVRKTNGNLYCAGFNSYGTIIDSTTAIISTPTLIATGVDNGKTWQAYDVAQSTGKLCWMYEVR